VTLSHVAVGCVCVIRTCKLRSITCWTSLRRSDPAD